MQWLAELSIKRPVFASVLVLSLVVVGVFSYGNLGVDRLIVHPGLDVPTERRYHAVPVDDIFRSIDHVAALAY